MMKLKIIRFIIVFHGILLRRLSGFYGILLAAGLIVASAVGCGSQVSIDNPYREVDWEQYGRYKADLHVHTSRSDGHFSPHVIVDRFHELGFRIVSITDHSLVTYPWQEFSSFSAGSRTHRMREREMFYLPDEKIFHYENRDPDVLGMVAIQGNEVSQHHHIGSYFNNHEDLDSLLSASETLEAIAAKGGLAVLFHPGAYDGSRPTRPLHSAEWYVDLFERFDHLVGMEAYNTGFSEQPANIQKWDSTLAQLMPDRPVWGFSNEDFHGDYRPSGVVRHILGRNGNIFLLPELSVHSVRQAMETGTFFLFHAPGGPQGPAPPVIHSIHVDPKKATIRIEASRWQSIQWISDGKVVHTGEEIAIAELPEIGGYVRAVLYESEGGALVGTQPFGIRKSR